MKGLTSFLAHITVVMVIIVTTAIFIYGGFLGFLWLIETIGGAEATGVVSVFLVGLLALYCKNDKDYL